MAENKKKDEALQKNLALLKKRALNVKFELDTSEYKPIENIGIGAYGVVCSAIHLKSNDRVAIKKIPGVFDYKDIAKRTYREIKILKHFTHDNVIRIREILKPKESLNDFKDIYVVFDLMESDLHKIIYSKQELTEEHVRYFLYQILRGLKYIHSAGVIHRDLKPSNLLVNEDCQLRIGDFGMARGIASSPTEPNYFMTQYVATRWYRAPEIMLSLIEYGAAVDMWSVGCIFAEMLGRKHLFPGKDSISQIKLIVGLIGTPKENLLRLCQSPIIKNFINEMGTKEPVPLQKLYPKASKKALNLLGRMLLLHPKERITVEQALVHPYLNKYHDPDDEPICVPSFNFDFEKEDLLIPQLRDSINTEIMEYHKPRTPTFSFNAFLRPVPKSSDSDLPFKTTSPFASSETTREITVKEEPSTISFDNQTCTHLIDVSKSNEDEVFKRPLSAQNKVSPVHVNTDNALKVDSDIEMLSAKSTDGKIPMSAQSTIVKEEKTKENTDPVKEEKNKTISEDTKNLIKAALRNESFKKRTDSVGDDERPRPITAAMRQKEREDKRKKKKEKSKERKRKDKKKKDAKDEILTSEDKELLQRWTKMQTTNVPIAPKPPDLASIATAQGQAQSKMTEGQGDKGGMSKEDLPSFPTNQRNVQQGTLNLLQQRLLANASSETVTSKQTSSDYLQNRPQTAQTLPSSVHNGSTTSHCSPDISATTQSQDNQQVFTTQPSIHIQPPEAGTHQNSPNFAVDFSNVNLGDLDFLSMLSSPDILSQNVETNNSMASTVSGHNNSHVPDQRNSGDASSQEPRTYLHQLCSGPAPITDRRLSDEVRQPQQLSVSPNYPDHVSPPQFFQGHSPGSQHSLSPGHQSGHELSPSHNIPIGAPYGSPTHPSSEPSHNFNPQMIPTHSANIPSHQTNIDMNTVDANNLFLSSRQGHSGILNQSNYGIVSNSGMVNQSNQGMLNQSNQVMGTQSNPGMVNQSNRGMVTQSNPGMMTQSNPGMVNQSNPGMMTQSNPGMVNQSNRGLVTHSNQAFMYRNQSGAQDALSSSNSNSNSPPALSVNIQEASLTMQQLFQGPVAGPSGASGNILDTHVDLVALLSKQLSKSNVEDLCPQLALTPRGTGGGYGVGVDLDALMMAQEAEGSQAAEPSPLSSSILADWMEVTGNMNIDMEALEQELQSPMALSYNDLNLYSS